MRVFAISLNAIDWKLRSGAMKAFMPLQFPAILGHDIAGTVETVGASVTRYHKGDRVMGYVTQAYAELIVAKEEAFALIPEGMSFETAAALPVVLLTGEQLINQGAKVKSGQTVLVTGALGSVGRSAVHAALKAGCTVIAGVRGAEKTKAMTLGVADAVAIDDESDVKRLAPYEVVADTVGGPVGKMLVALTKSGGTFATVVGVPENAKDHPDVHVTMVSSQPNSATLERLAKDVAAGEFEIPIGRSFPLKDAAEAHAVAEKGGVGKVLLIP